MLPARSHALRVIRLSPGASFTVDSKCFSAAFIVAATSFTVMVQDWTHRNSRIVKRLEIGHLMTMEEMKDGFPVFSDRT